MNSLPVAARLRIIFVAFTLAGLLFHAQIADALTLQGDSDLSAGRAKHALTIYARALFFDPESVEAVERYSNAAYFYGSDAEQRAALRYDRIALVQYPKRVSLLTSTALCATRFGDFSIAAYAYAMLGNITHDPRYYVLAGHALKRDGDLATARQSWHRALQVAPGNLSARKALASVGEVI